MARYNLWQNGSLLSAADGLGDDVRRQERGAFFGSIFGTLNHLLWADLIWMSRFDGGAPPEGGIDASPGLLADWHAYCAARAQADKRILGWADRLNPEDLAGDLTWVSGATGREMARPMGLCAVHLFNHQTHHRGQVHAMLTAAGARPGPTDLVFMPEDVGL
ncbi:damage-inducible protein DinB [Roseovarius sp. M141]|nr:damage-inducible protein DinB [Roseovarius sp. M141]